MLRAPRNEGNAQISAIDVYRDDLFGPFQAALSERNKCHQLICNILFIPVYLSRSVDSDKLLFIENSGGTCARGCWINSIFQVGFILLLIKYI